MTEQVIVPGDDEFVDLYYCVPGSADGVYASGSTRVKFKGIGLWIALALMEGGAPVLVTGMRRLETLSGRSSN